MTTVAGTKPVGGSRPPKSGATSVTLHNCKTPQNKTNTPAHSHLLSISGQLVLGDWQGGFEANWREAPRQKCRNSVTKLKFRGLPLSQGPAPCVDQLRERPAEEKEETGNFYRRMLRGAARFSEVFVEVVDYIYQKGSEVFVEVEDYIYLNQAASFPTPV